MEIPEKYLASPSYLVLWTYMYYGKCPKISNSFWKMTYANSVDRDQTAPEGIVKVYTVSHSTKHFKKQLHKNKILSEKSME